MKNRIFFWLIFFVNINFLFARFSSSNDSLYSELHWSLCGNSSREIIRKLDIEPENTEERFVTFYDLKKNDGSFEFFNQGVVLRLRVDADNEASTAIKIKVNGLNDFIDQNTLAEDEKYKCEEDRYVDRKSYFCSLSRHFRFPSRTLFSENQKAFLNKKFLRELQLEKLSSFGPVLNNVWVFSRSTGFVLEEMRLPDATSFYELSKRVPFDEAEKKYREYSDFLQKKNVHLCEIQESKTLKVLNFFKNIF